MTGAGQQREHTSMPEIPPTLAERLPATVPRQFLRDKIEAALKRSEELTKSKPSVTLVIGEPGTGKTVLAGQLAAAWTCPTYFLRLGSVRGLTLSDPKNVLVSLGFQLRALYGAEIFGAPTLEISGELEAEKITKEGKAAALKADVVSLSPFRRILIAANIRADEIAGEALLVKIGELRDVVVDLTPAQLAQEAVLQPLQRLSSMHPGKRQQIIVDALDENPEIAGLLPLAGESPSNVDWILTSRPGDHLNSFVDGHELYTLIRFSLSDPIFADSNLDDARQYTESLLQDSSFTATFERSPVANRPLAQFAFDLASASRGNFLYLYHLIQAIRSEAEDGRFELLTKPIDSLPQGLDGIYRYFITELIVPKASLRDWVDLYTPVLGILAVARTALESSRLASFSRLDRLTVNRVLGTVRPFLKVVPQNDHLAYSFYHPSFAEFLLTQDDSRNPYPLKPEPYYHSMIGNYYPPPDAAQWSNTTDRYALLHLPVHLLQAGQLEAACRLLGGPFGGRQMIMVGTAQTWSDVRAVARMGALSGKDEILLQMLDAVADVEADVEKQWQSGLYVLGLLSGDPTAILERTGYQETNLETVLSGWALPWSGFLVAERLMDLGATQTAREVLRRLLRKPWPEIEALTYGAVNMMEGSSYDFVLETATVTFLMKVARIEPDLALALTKRLYTDEPKLPNARTAWREIIEVFIAWRSDLGEPATAAQCQKLAEVTCDWLRDGGYVLGWVGLTHGLFHLLARSLPVAEPLWLVNSILLASECRLAARNTIQGGSEQEGSEPPDKRPGLWAALADVISGLLEIRDSAASDTILAGDKATAAVMGPSGAIKEDSSRGELDAANQEAPLLKVLDEFLEKVIRDVPEIDIPRRPSFGPRAEYLAHLTSALSKAGSDRWREHGQVALTVCQMDMATNDPPKRAVVRALLLLLRIHDPKFHANVEDMISRLGLSSGIQEAANSESITIKDALAPPTLDKLIKATDSFERGRIALALWASGAARLAELKTALGEASQSAPKKTRGRLNDQAPPIFIELLAESLISVLAKNPSSWARQAIEKLDMRRRPERRTGHRLDEAALRFERLRALIASKDWKEFRREAEEQWQAAMANSNYTSALGICMLTISFEPDLANLWYLELRKRLKKPVDHGTAVVSLVSQLKTLKPERLPDLGQQWVRDLPPPDPNTRIYGFQLRLCEQWGDLDIFRPQLIANLNQLAGALPKKIEEIRLNAAEAERRRNNSSMTDQNQDDNDPREMDAWILAGEVLKSASQVVVREQDGSVLAAQRLGSAVRQSLEDLASEIPEWELRSHARIVLKEMTEDTIGPCKPGPIADTAIQLFSIATTGPGDEDDSDVDAEDSALQKRQDMLLAISLASLLKESKPEWSTAQFNLGLTSLQSLIVDKPTSSDWMDSMIEGVVNVFAAAVSRGSRFRNSRDRELFSLTTQLSNWCSAAPPSPDRLVQLQALVGGLSDADLRNLLLAPLAVAWMQLDDISRIGHIVQLAGPSPLMKAGFHDRLRSHVAQLFNSDQRDEISSHKALVLDLVLLTPLHTYDEALEDMISCWVLLRAKEIATISGISAQNAYLERLAEWTLAVAHN